MVKFLTFFILISTPFTLRAAQIEFMPASPIQGEPVLITLYGVSATSSIKDGFFNKQPLNFFIYEGKTLALAGIDLLGKIGTSSVIVNFKDGTKIFKELIVSERPKIEMPMEIPQKLGGNTKVAAQKLITNLISEQATIGKISSIVKSKIFWKEKFRFPIMDPIVTDNYGYSRDTVGYSISHKGTDFKAEIGTPVLAINRGVVRDNNTYTSFGKTIIVDHGFGLYSMYMHLSKTKVNVGQLVLPGQVIALSGDTGYTTGAHLHLTIRINGISIDPIKFYELFGVRI